ncbi:hypothetical protein NDU88_001402 [Pleurodeles waltl]|uniref:Uncharacterized protein n=1 Tax=Pleurodeles waltl TaxID=8319 RepID=A0AAV7M0Z8_PLEWA|nr:hypothetical protein NDU88_001402 [Pleurodeles waltl]
MRTGSTREALEESATRTSSRTRERMPFWRLKTWARRARRTQEEPVTVTSYTARESSTQKPATSQVGHG